MSGIADRLPLSLATELARQYDVVRELGRGGMGAVWLARERSLERFVAIKVLSADAVARSGDIRERFRREARIAARLVHPNIVPLHAFGETPDALYCVMGYVEGETLATRLDREGKLARQAALQILGEISDALAFAHREGVVHRDVKPENILLDAKSGRALLADFGIARLTGGATSMTMTGVAVGTPSYMAPEQAVGSAEIDGRADIYSLGVVGYRMLMGRLPFTGDTQQALMAQHAVARPDDLALAVAPAERGIARVIMRALEKDPAARWARAEHLADELRNAARSEVALPEELERLETVGTKMLFGTLCVGGALYVGLLGNARWFSAPEAWIAIVASVSLFPLLGLGLAYPAARTFGWRDTLRTMLHPVKSWAHWWPRALRRQDDIWDRLPPPLRRVRNIIAGVAAWISWDLLALPLLMSSGFAHALSAWGRSVGIADPVLFVGPKVLAFSWIAVEFVRARKKLGLTAGDFSELLGFPNVATHPGWLKPKFARLLAPETTSAPKQHTPRTPDELAHAIAELNHRLIRLGLLPDTESAVAAESVRLAIGVLEAEVQRLHQDLDPAEGERLERRLAALGSGDDDHELRRLLEGQRAVWRRLEQRRHEKESRRDRMHDQLVTLWMQLVELDARAARGSPADAELTGQVRALSHALGRADEALSEADRIIAPVELNRPVVTPH